VLTADNQYQQAKLGYIQAQALRLQDTGALFVALGGGWWHAAVNREAKAGIQIENPSAATPASSSFSPEH
jgi:hypothetical protein